MKKPRWASAVVSLLAVGVGGIFLLWSLACLLGGPDGRIGAPESFVYAFFFWLIGFMTVIYSWKWFRRSLNGVGPYVKNTDRRAFNVKAGAVMEGRKGEKIGWTIGFFGSFLWVLILALIFLMQKKLAEGFSGLLLTVVAVFCIVSFAPWRHPSTPYWKFMTPIFALFFAAAAWAMWAFGPAAASSLTWWDILWLIPVLLPLFMMGKKTWNGAGNHAKS
jgi:hypothetical protein